jgi:hypothetical protein
LGCTFAGTEEEIANHVLLMDLNGLHESQISNDPKPFCIGCYRLPNEISEYSKVSTQTKLEPDEFVKREEGTYNEENGHFLCTSCYIKAGQPSASGGWKAP